MTHHHRFFFESIACSKTPAVVKPSDYEIFFRSKGSILVIGLFHVVNKLFNRTGGGGCCMGITISICGERFVVVAIHKLFERFIKGCTVSILQL